MPVDFLAQMTAAHLNADTSIVGQYVFPHKI